MLVLKVLHTSERSGQYPGVISAAAISRPNRSDARTKKQKQKTNTHKQQQLYIYIYTVSYTHLTLPTSDGV